MTEETSVMLDGHGYSHNVPLTRYQYSLAIGWGLMILSLVFNALYYKLHPMRVSMNPCGKLETPICGFFCCPFCSEDDEDFEVGAGFKTQVEVKGNKDDRDEA